MANTHDYIIANDTGLNVRNDFNTLFLEIEHSNAGDTLPGAGLVAAKAGKLWFDTTTDHLKYYTGSEWDSIARTARGAANINPIVRSITPNGTTTVPGSGTKFTTQARVGDQIVVNSQTRTITAIASDTSLTVNTLITAGSADASPEIHPASFVVVNDSGVIDMLIDTDGNIEGSGGIGIATTGKAIAMAVVFGG